MCSTCEWLKTPYNKDIDLQNGIKLLQVVCERLYCSPIQFAGLKWLFVVISVLVAELSSLISGCYISLV